MLMKIEELFRTLESAPHHQHLIIVLSALGLDKNEIAKILSVRTRSGTKHSDSMDEDSSTFRTNNPQMVMEQVNSIDITAADILPSLTLPNVVELIMGNIVKLSDDHVPPVFLSSYIPSEMMSVPDQIHRLARLIGARLNSLGLGRGFALFHQEDQAIQTSYEQLPRPEGLQHLYGLDYDSVEVIGSSSGIGDLNEPGTNLKKLSSKEFRLADVTRTMPYDEMNRMAMDAFRRVLNTEDTARIFGGVAVRRRIMTSLIVMFGQSYRDIYEEYLFNDVASRTDLMMNWIFHEYARLNNFLNEQTEPETTNRPSRRDETKYEDALSRILDNLQERCDQKDRVFARTILSAPYITESVMTSLARYSCEDIAKCSSVLTTLRELMITRRPIRYRCLDQIIDLTGSQVREVRNCAIHQLVSLHDERQLIDIEQILEKIEEVAVRKLHYLHRLHVNSNETDEQIRTIVEISASLFLNWLIQKPSLLLELAMIFGSLKCPKISDCLFSMIDEPIQCIDSNKPELVELVQVCPLEARNFLIKTLMILSEETELPDSVREKVQLLYESDPNDHRLLLPILTSVDHEKADVFVERIVDTMSSESEIRQAFERLWRNPNYSPSELFFKLHTIAPFADSSPNRIKNILAATKLCFNRSSIFKDSVLLETIKRLMELPNAPFLLLRTIIQTINTNQHLIKDIMTLLDSFIVEKRLWEYPKLWEGFIKCCQICQPHSIPLLFRIPTTELARILQKEKNLAVGLWAYLNDINLTDQERSNVPKEILQAIYSLQQQTQQQQFGRATSLNMIAHLNKE
ncbi:hypothetical protein ACOME3_002811 [Neoechinorhynchus agilis]